MAHYEYRCGECKKDFEVEQKISEEPLEACPECGEKIEFCKLISLSSFSLKGQGWFKKGGY
jgi:putative FmdB family regulatory protein